MAISTKYGQVTLENGDIGEDEPVFVFRAQDKLVTRVLTYYRAISREAGSPSEYLAAILDARKAIIDWQGENPTKTPS